MLRLLWGEPPRAAEGALAEAFAAMDRFASLLSGRIKDGQDEDHKLRTYEVWTVGLTGSLDELEQSRYAAARFAAAIIDKPSLAQMSADEKLDYYRYVYFDKNAFIRLFAILDKLGTLLNDALELETEKIKPHFSYFTVLRGMSSRKLHPPLAERLTALKERHGTALNALRKRRNAEVHYMNSELLDDLRQSHRAYGQEAKLENIALQLEDLDSGFDMATGSLTTAFAYLNRHFGKRR